MADGVNDQTPEQNVVTTDWLRLRPWREFSALALMVMDINWILPLFQSLTKTGAEQETLRAGLILGGILIAAYVIARLLFLLKLNAVFRQTILILTLVAASFFVIKNFLYPHQQMGPSAVFERMSADFADPVVILPAELMLLIVTAFIWWRGVQLAHIWLGPATARRSFRWGTIMLLVVAFLQVESGLQALVPHLALFMFSALVAIGAARTASLSQMRGADQEPLTFHWLAGMLALAVGMVAVAATVAVFLAGEPSGLISMLVLWIVRIVLAVILILVSPIMLAMIFLFTWLTTLVNDSPVLQAMQEELVEIVKTLADFFYTVGGFLRDLWITLPSIPWVKPVILWGLVGLTLFLLFRRFGLKWRLPFVSRFVSPAHEVEPLETDMMASLRAWLGRRADDLSQRLTRFSLNSKLMAAARIRRIYAQLMALAAELDSPRRTWQTPLEFMVTLHGLFPEHSDELVAVTGAYVRVRYGELPESRAELTHVESAWKALKARGRELKKVRQVLEDQAKQEKLRSDFTIRRTQ
jgi:hypothetical protein